MGESEHASRASVLASAKSVAVRRIIASSCLFTLLFYYVGDLHRVTVAAALRAEYTVQRDLSVQLYARPYISAGSYRALREVVDPGAVRFQERFRSWGMDELIVTTSESGRTLYGIDRTGDGVADVTIADPAFNQRSLQTNAVLRWEFRPGSTLYAVWSHDRLAGDREAFRFGRDVETLARAAGGNVVMVKVAYWVGR